MSTRATSLKLPNQLKTRVEAVARAAGKTAHAFMVDAIEHEASRAETYEAFLDDALQAEREMVRTGVHYRAADVFGYMTARAAGKQVRRPRAKTWPR